VIDSESRNLADEAIHSGIAVYSRNQSAVFAAEESLVEDGDGGAGASHALEADASLWTEGTQIIFSSTARLCGLSYFVFRLMTFSHGS
jgi:hypothetical protein